ncbi:MAG: hypothetical protein KatS3mg027_0224 [Bacteroidia bacterium]|nr:MAG: hypothetical protein KatS3mg027_0224 [Bacteroidia bacterium]
MELIKFITAGNVDDGKSTLIGRLLYDSKAISNDVLESIQQTDGEINFAYFTDGLKAEREQGITIDVAYKYFSTEKRKFIIADCPGHKEYTRNMITGASHADIAIIMIDATNGITEQTRRHSFIVDIMNIPCIIFCVNKMDVVNYDESVFQRIIRQIADFKFINKHQIEYVPVSALKGDNVVFRSENMSWYDGSTLLYILENYQYPDKMANLPAYMQVQYVSFQNDERYFFGTLLNGNFETGQEILVMPTQQRNKIKEIFVLGKNKSQAEHGESVALTFMEDTEIQRGYTLMALTSSMDELPEQNVQLTQTFSAICFWLDEVPFIPSKRYLIQQHSFRTYVKCQSIAEIFDLNELKFKEYHSENINSNSIFKAQFQTAQPMLVSNYTQSTILGTFILIDETSYKTVGAGVLLAGH